MILAMVIIMNDDDDGDDGDGGDDDDDDGDLRVQVSASSAPRPPLFTLCPPPHFLLNIVVNSPKTDILTKCVGRIDTIKSGFAKKFDGGKEVSLLFAYSAKSEHLTNQTEHDW